MTYDLDTFWHSVQLDGQYASVPGGNVTLYGTCYALMGQYYLGQLNELPEAASDFILGTQDPESGQFIGPEIQEFPVDQREHLLHHLACTVLPLLQQFEVRPRHPLRFAHAYCDLDYLQQWLDQRDWRVAWLEGNNLLFIGQLLVYLRDVEQHPGAAAALQRWFDWHDAEMDPSSGLWGTNGYCSPFQAMCGGYHQLLVYYYEQHPLPYHKALVDTTLTLQHWDGGFAPTGGGGACEDVDAVDILVNCYKLFDYRRADIRFALRKTYQLLRNIQQPDGGFPYKRNQPQDHMGIPATRAGRNVSTAFATWFRLHTLALLAEILTDEPELQQIPWRFNRALSMGWHRPWNKTEHTLSDADRGAEAQYASRFRRTAGANLVKGYWKKVQYTVGLGQ